MKSALQVMLDLSGLLLMLVARYGTPLPLMLTTGEHSTARTAANPSTTDFEAVFDGGPSSTVWALIKPAMRQGVAHVPPSWP
jgi:hypothetical protein